MFTVIDKDIQERSSTTVLRCECGGIEMIHDQPDDDRATDEAERIHEHVPACILCGEPLPVNDRIIGARIDRGCWTDSPREAALALGAFIESRKQEVA